MLQLMSLESLKVPYGVGRQLVSFVSLVSFVISSDRSSYNGSVLLYLYSQATLSDFEHFRQYMMSVCLLYDFL